MTHETITQYKITVPKSHMDPLHVMTDEQFMRMVFHIRGTRFGWPPRNPAADALISLYGMICEANTAEEARVYADQIGGQCAAYCEELADREYWAADVKEDDE